MLKAKAKSNELRVNEVNEERTSDEMEAIGATRGVQPGPAAKRVEPPGASSADAAAAKKRRVERPASGPPEVQIIEAIQTEHPPPPAAARGP